MSVTSDGIELDVVTRHSLLGTTAIAECKAYSRNLQASDLTNFYGKLTVERFDNPNAFGVFCALPRLTAAGEEKARQIREKDDKFLYLSSTDIAGELLKHGVVGERPTSIQLASDAAVLITEHGIYSAALVLDPVTRTPVRVAVWAAADEPVPLPVLNRLQQAEYAAELPVADARTDWQAEGPSRELQDAVIVPVRGSGSDFEYQLPASPRYFVGRSAPVAALEEALSAGAGVLVLNAQSGWGKSSLALKLQERTQARSGYAVVLDSRTANSPRYVVEVLRTASVAAAAAGVCELPVDASWASLNSAVATLAHATWASPDRPLVVFFDQFENVFRNEELTRSFRDLALAVREFSGPFLLGFAWKTDLVGWTEGHPYRLRDDIRGAATVVRVEPFGPDEVNILLRRLEKQADQKLYQDLRSRLRTFSQGLPWLLKKLADHVLNELQKGVTQEQLLAEALNVQFLFEADLSELNPLQHEVLRHVARYAPIAASEVTERYEHEVVQSLVDRRLLVQVGDRLDTYWDTFRDYLVTGRVPVEDSYILRQTPQSVARLLPLIMGAGGNASIKSLTSSLGTSDTYVFNLSRELRLLGVTAQEPNRVRLVDEIMKAPAATRESTLRRRVAAALRRHKAYSILRSLAERNGGVASSTAYARALPSAFPAVEAAESAWQSYARAFLFWISYAGLAEQSGSDYRPTPDGLDGASQLRLLEGRPPLRVKSQVPYEAPSRPLRLAKQLADGSLRLPSSGPDRDAVRTLACLGIARVGQDGEVFLADPDYLTPGGLRRALAEVPGGRAGLELLEAQPSASPAAVGEVIRQAVGAEWKPSNVHSVGGHFRAWAKAAGVEVRQVPRARGAAKQQSAD